MRLWIVVLVAVAGSNTACQRPPDRSVTLNTLAQRHLQARRDSGQRRIQSSQYATRPVELRRPTVIAFYPGIADSTEFPIDTLALRAVAPFRRRLDRYRVACAKAGYLFEVRDSRGVHVLQPRLNVVRSFRVAPDSVGLIVAIPNEPLRVWYGLQLEATLAARLRALLPGRLAPLVGT